MDIPPPSIGGVISGGSAPPLRPQDARNPVPSRHPTPERTFEQLGDLKRGLEHRADEKESSSTTAYGSTDGPQGLGAVRFHVPQRGSTTTTQETPSCACNCHSAGHVHPATSSSPMPPPPPSPPRAHDTASSTLGRDRDGRESSRDGEGALREITEDKTPRPPQYALPEQGREPRLQRNHSILLKDKDSTSSSQEPLLPRELPPKDQSTSSHISGGTSTRGLLDAPLPSLPRDDRNDGVQGLRRARTRESLSPEYGNLRPPPPSRGASGIDWIVPLEEDEKHSYSRSSRKRLTVAERLQPTLDMAKETRAKLAKKAQLTKYLQNGAIGLQVLLGSLTTGLSAVATTGRQMAVQTTILGGLTTIIASYLAKTRNSDQAEFVRERVGGLDKFIRTCTSFLLDHGHSDDPVHDKLVVELRREFDELLDDGHDREKKQGASSV